MGEWPQRLYLEKPTSVPKITLLLDRGQKDQEQKWEVGGICHLQHKGYKPQTQGSF